MEKQNKASEIKHSDFVSCNQFPFIVSTMSMKENNEANIPSRDINLVETLNKSLLSNVLEASGTTLA